MGHYIKLRETKFKSTLIKQQTIVREVGKDLINRSNLSFTANGKERLLKSLAAKMELKLKRVFNQKKGKNPQAGLTLFMIESKQQFFNLNNFACKEAETFAAVTSSFLSKKTKDSTAAVEAASISNLKPPILRNDTFDLGTLETTASDLASMLKGTDLEDVKELRRLRILPPAYKFDDGQNFVQLDQSTRVYCLILSISESGRNYVNLDRTISAAKAKQVSDATLAYIINCFMYDIGLVSAVNRDLLFDDNKV